MTRRISLFVDSVSSAADGRVIVTGEVGWGPLLLGDVFVMTWHDPSEEAVSLEIATIASDERALGEAGPRKKSRFALHPSGTIPVGGGTRPIDRRERCSAEQCPRVTTSTRTKRRIVPFATIANEEISR